MKFIRYIVCVLTLLCFGCNPLSPPDPFSFCGFGDSNFETGNVNRRNEFTPTTKRIILAKDSDFDLLRFSYAAMVYRIKIEKNEQNDNVDSLYAYIKYKDQSGKTYTSPEYESGYKVWFYRTGETESCYEYLTLRGDGDQYVNGKPFFLIKEKELGSVSHPNYYLIPYPHHEGTEVININIPSNQ